MGLVLVLLEGDALVPDQAETAAIDSDGLLWVVAPWRSHFGYELGDCSTP